MSDTKAVSKTRTDKSKSDTDRWWSRSAAILVFVSGGLLFTGWSYMDTLLGSFGLRVGILGLGDFELALAGVVPAIFALWDAAKQFLIIFVAWAAVAMMPISILVYFKSKGYLWPTRISERIDAIATAKAYRVFALQFLPIAIVVLIGFGAGFAGARIDERAIRERAIKPALCYSFTNGRTVGGVMIQQSEVYTILKLRDSTRVFSTSELLEVKNCKGPRP